MTTSLPSEPSRLWSRIASSSLTLVVAATLPVALGALVITGLLYREIRQAKESELRAVVQTISAAVDVELIAAQRTAAAFAVSQPIADAEWSEFDTSARAILSTQPQITAILVTDLPAATYLVHTSLPPGTTGPAGAVAMEQSRIVAESGKTTIFGVRSTGPTVPEPIIPVRAPIFRDGQVTQTVSVTLSPAYLSDVYRSSKFPPTRTGAIVDPNLVIAARNRSPEQYVGKRVTPQLEQALKAGTQGIFRSVNQEGQSTYSVFFRSEETGWISVAGLPTSELDDAVAAAIGPVVVGGLLAGGIGVGIASYIAMRIRRARRSETEFSYALARLVDERTAELRESERRLYEAQKMESIGHLTGGMAHDFNNYLGVMIGNLEMLRGRKGIDAEGNSLIDSALAGATRAGDLTRSLLAFSRRQPLDPQHTDINRRVAGIAGLLKGTLGELIAVRQVYQPDLWRVRVDPAQLDSAIVNLATNARDAMRRGGDLTISTSNVSLDPMQAGGALGLEPGDYVVISVTDSGVGMPPEVLGRAFEPFFSTKPVGHGTGLGLSMVFGFVKQSGGTVSLRSEVGRGTTVDIYLPRAAETDDVAAMSLVAVTLSGAPSRSILVVEDNDLVRRTVLAQLASLGYVAIEAASAADALSILDQQDTVVDLLFTDIVMPGGIDGRELGILALQRRPAIKVLLTSGFAGHASADQNIPFESMMLLAKPYPYKELARVLETMLGSAR